MYSNYVIALIFDFDLILGVRFVDRQDFDGMERNGAKGDEGGRKG